MRIAIKVAAQLVVVWLVIFGIGTVQDYSRTYFGYSSAEAATTLVAGMAIMACGVLITGFMWASEFKDSE